MPKTKDEQAAEREAAQAALNALIESGTLAGDIARELAEEFDKINPTTLRNMALTAAQVAEATIDGIDKMEAVGAHIGVDYVRYPNGTVQVDAAGNLVSVEIEGRVHLL